jgi:hypothetical protein
MNEPTNAPMLPPPSGVSEWFSVWRDAITRPSDQTFARLAQSPNAKLTTAFLWIFLSSLVSSLLALPARGVWMRQMMQMMQSAGFEGQFPDPARGGLFAVICGVPIGAVVSVIVFAIVVGVVQLLAKMFGGSGTFDQLAYAIAAIVTPYYLVSGVFSLLSAIPFAGFCFGPLLLLAGLYVLVLEVMAVKGVNQFEWWQAIASLLLPVFAFFCCIALAAAGIWSVLAPRLNEIFNSIPTPMP